MKRIFFFLIMAITLTSCGAYKRLAYFQDMDTNTYYDVTQKAEARIAVGDELAIGVRSSQPELAAPFNINTDIQLVDTTKIGSVATADMPKYTVDTKGRINFPVLGPVHVEGMTLNELRTLLVDEIRATNYLKDPVVSAAFANFNVTVLGEFTKSGIYNIPSGEINIIDLLAKVGDLSQDAQRDNVWVIRTMGGTRKVFPVNPKSKAIFDSPVYYLQQNDLVYAAPVDRKLDTRSRDVLTLITTPMTILSTIFSGLALVLSYARYAERQY